MSKRRWLVIAVAFLLTIGLYAAMRTTPSSQQTSNELEFSASESESLEITHLVTVGEQAYTAEVASTAEEQATGLSARDSLPEASGMLFPFLPPQIVSFWMKDMRFPIDIVWIANGKVIGVEKNVPPPQAGAETQSLPTYQPPQPVNYVLELNAGQSQFFKVGDNVTITGIQST